MISMQTDDPHPFRSGMSEDIKQFLYAWLGKQKKATPVYDVRPSGPKNRQRFLCRLSVSGYTYVACGNSTNKKGMTEYMKSCAINRTRLVCGRD